MSWKSRQQHRAHTARDVGGQLARLFGAGQDRGIPGARWPGSITAQIHLLGPKVRSVNTIDAIRPNFKSAGGDLRLHTEAAFHQGFYCSQHKLYVTALGPWRSSLE